MKCKKANEMPIIHCIRGSRVNREHEMNRKSQCNGHYTQGIHYKNQHTGKGKRVLQRLYELLQSPSVFL